MLEISAVVSLDKHQKRMASTWRYFLSRNSRGVDSKPSFRHLDAKYDSIPRTNAKPALSERALKQLQDYATV